MLKNKEDIPDYDKKAKFLIDNGWQTWYHDDNWVRNEDFNSPSGPDRSGRSTDSAYASETNLSDLVQVRSIGEKDFRYRNWSTVRRELANRLKDVEIREID